MVFKSNCIDQWNSIQIQTKFIKSYILNNNSVLCTYSFVSIQLNNEKGVYFAIIIMGYFLEHKSPEVFFADVCIPVKKVILKETSFHSFFDKKIFKMWYLYHFTRTMKFCRISILWCHISFSSSFGGETPGSLGFTRLVVPWFFLNILQLLYYLLGRVNHSFKG